MLAALRRPPLFTVSVLLEGQRYVRRTAVVFVGNNEYRFDGLSFGDRRRLDGGRLSFYLALRNDRWGMLALGLRALLGNLRDGKDYDALTATAISIQSAQPRIAVAIDGEVAALEAPLQFRILPRALRVIVPQDPAPDR
jgi:diacylglycerol kinase family enzyme